MYTERTIRYNDKILSKQIMRFIFISSKITEIFKIVVIRGTLYQILQSMTGWKIPVRGEKFRRSRNKDIYDDKICTKVDINARRARIKYESYTLDDVHVRHCLPLHGSRVWSGEVRGSAAVTLCGFPLMCNIRSQPYAVSRLSCERCVLDGISLHREIMCV